MTETAEQATVVVAAAPSFGGPWAFPDEREAAALTAAIAGRIPVSPPREWFDPEQVPELDGPLTFTEDGRVFGLLAPRDVPHIGLPGQNRHAPYSASGYSLYHTGQVRCADGSLVSTGRVTMGGGHCDLTADAAGAARWYDDVGTAIADVVAWDTPGGVMCAGAARPHLTAEQIRTAMASPPSGDWRPIKGDLEMVGAHLVNVAGFPASRAALAASGTPTALIASGAAPFRIVAAALTAANTDPAGTVYEDGSVKGGKKSGGGGSSGWDESKHPRDAIGQWAPKDEAGKQAQKDASARSNYGKLEGASDADADKMLKGMSDGDLRKLTAFAYSSKTSDPRIVKARIKVANEMGRRGIDIKKHGARGGGKKGATRASGELVAAAGCSNPTCLTADPGSSCSCPCGGAGHATLVPSGGGSGGSGGSSGGSSPSSNRGGDGAASAYGPGKVRATREARQQLDERISTLAKQQPEIARRQRAAVDELDKAGKLTPDRARIATQGVDRLISNTRYSAPVKSGEGLGAKPATSPSRTNAARPRQNTPSANMARRNLDMLRGVKEDRAAYLGKLSTDELKNVHETLRGQHRDATSPSTKTQLGEISDSIREEYRRRRGTVAASGQQEALMSDDGTVTDEAAGEIAPLDEDDVDVEGLLAAGDGPPAPHDKPAKDVDGDSPEGPSFSEGDRVTIGDTGLSGHVQSVDDGQAHVSVTVGVDALTAAEDDDEAMAAAADPNTSMLEGLTASVSALTDMVASMQAERRAEKAQSILDGLS